MSILALHDRTDHSGILRWGLSAAIVLVAHLAMLMLAMIWYAQSPPRGGIPLASIQIDLSPASSSPGTQQMELPPGPDMQRVETPPVPPEPKPEAVEPQPAPPPLPELKPEAVQQQPATPEPIAPTPPLDKPIVEAPPEPKPTVTEKAEPTRIMPEPAKPAPAKPKPVRREVESDRPAGPRDRSAPKGDQQARTASAGSPGAANGTAATADYAALVNAEIRQNSHYPQSANPATGTAVISFTIGASGRVISSAILQSSGNGLLDSAARQTVSVLSLPPPPGGRFSRTVPLHFRPQ